MTSSNFPLQLSPDNFKHICRLHGLFVYQLRLIPHLSKLHCKLNKLCYQEAGCLKKLLSTLSFLTKKVFTEEIFKNSNLYQFTLTP